MGDGITKLTPEQFAAQEVKTSQEGYILRDLIALDIEANVLTGGLEDETISSRLARDAEQHKVIGVVGSKILDLFQKDHGAKAQAGDVERAEAVLAAEAKLDGQTKN